MTTALRVQSCPCLWHCQQQPRHAHYLFYNTWSHLLLAHGNVYVRVLFHSPFSNNGSYPAGAEHEEANRPHRIVRLFLFNEVLTDQIGGGHQSTRRRQLRLPWMFAKQTRVSLCDKRHTSHVVQSLIGSCSRRFLGGWGTGVQLVQQLSNREPDERMSRLLIHGMVACS